MSFVKEISLEKPIPLSPEKKKEVKALLDKQYAEESKLVKGVFKNIECPGGTESFAFRKFPQDPIRMYELADGQTYEIPLAVARHINNTCNEKQHQWVVDAQGKKTVDVTRGRQRFQFLSTEFM